MILSEEDRIKLASKFNNITFSDGEYSYIVTTNTLKDVNSVCDDIFFDGVKYYLIVVMSKQSFQDKHRNKHIGLMIKEDYLNYILNNNVKLYIDSFVVYIHDVGNYCLEKI